MKILVKTPISPYSGYGQDGIGILRALLATEHDVFLHPTHVDPPLPADIAQLLTRRLEAPFDVLLHHTDPGQLGLSEQARRAAKTTIAWTMWESSSLDNLRGKSSLKRRLRDYDLVLGYDAVTTEAFRPYLPRQGMSRLATLQGGFWPEDWKPVARDWFSVRFGFLMHGQLHERKDPFVAVQAFQELKTELPEEFAGAELHLHTTLPGLHPAMEECIPKLRIYYETWTVDTLREFYGKQHVLLAPSRGEGKHLPSLEFQSTGGAVIATHWGGMASWLDPSFAYPLHYTMAPIDGGHPRCLQARADKDHLKQLMLHVYRNRAEVKAKGELGSRVIPISMSWDSVIARLFDILAAQ
jgi:glycosyltransferase involved in cell wall biosynthesis